MSLSRKIVAAVDARPATDPLPAPLTVEDGANRMTLHLTAAGPVGLAFSALNFVATRPEWPPAALQRWAENLASRLTYLMEPLVVLEHDRIEGAIALRSQSPTPRAEHRAYYEVRLDRQGALGLTRIAFDDATRTRRPVACQMTVEVLERLTDDLVASLP